MKYFLIAGEASGDLHGSNLMKELKIADSLADFRFFGGDLMQQQGGQLIKHYREMAYMGFIPVLLHLKTIMNNLRFCENEILSYNPDVVILIDFPGFNLKIAKFIKQRTKIPTFYYISPKIWAWKEYRIKSFKKYIDEMFSILPFEVNFFKKHNYTIHYVGNPTVDAVEIYKESHQNDLVSNFISDNNLDERPKIAILAGSRKQEIKNNLPHMLKAVCGFSDYQCVIAGAPSISSEFYEQYIGNYNCSIVFNQTYRLLNFSKIALVTSGTATLETALFKVPQIVCYKMSFPYLAQWGFDHILHTKYISLVNLISDNLVVKELFAKSFSDDDIKNECSELLNNNTYRMDMLAKYDKLLAILGKGGASYRAARLMINILRKNK